MLKITAHSQESITTLELEGRFAGLWVAELRDCWQRAIADGGQVRVFLKQVTFIDDGGKRLLIEMCRSGAEIIGEGCMTKAIIERVKAGGR